MSSEQLAISQREKLYVWPHGASHIFACFSCTIGMYNINRFGYLVYQYKGPFLVQFIILSIVLGLPFCFLVMALGNSMGRVRADVWSISPAFKGLGVAMLYVNVIIGTCGSLPLSWILRYFRDSFVANDEPYKWSHCHPSLLKSRCNESRSYLDVIGSAVPSYLHLNILKRKPSGFDAQSLQFEPILYLGIIWVIVFLCLCYKLKLYGKVVYVLSLVPLILLSLILVRFAEEWSSGICFIFDASWRVNMKDSWSWLLAGREVVMTWILCSYVLLHICSCNKREVPIGRSFFVVTILTSYALVASSFLFCCGIESLKSHGAVYVHSSYEDVTSTGVLKHLNNSRTQHIQIANLWMGENLVTPPESKQSSGYQPIRFSIEMIPIVFSLEGTRNMSPFWAVSFYSMLLFFGFGQQISQWWCVVNSVVTMNPELLRRWETLISFGLCSLGFCLSLPMTTNVGILVVYYLDCCIGSLWWILFIFFIMLVAIMFIEGKPYGIEEICHYIARQCVLKKLIIPILVIKWNIILPIGYLVISIVFLRASQYEMNFPWTARRASSWSQWSRYLGVMIQIFPLIVMMSICLTQLCRHLCKNAEDGSSNESVEICCCCSRVDSESINRRWSTESVLEGSADAPPKYSPPPSYSTATSRALRNIVRRVSTSIELATTDVVTASPPDLISYHSETTSYI